MWSAHSMATHQGRSCDAMQRIDENRRDYDWRNHSWLRAALGELPGERAIQEGEGTMKSNALSPHNYPDTPPPCQNVFECSKFIVPCRVPSTSIAGKYPKGYIALCDFCLNNARYDARCGRIKYKCESAFKPEVWRNWRDANDAGPRVQRRIDEHPYR